MSFVISLERILRLSNKMLTSDQYRLGSRRLNLNGSSWGFLLFAFSMLPIAHSLDPAAQFATSLFTDFAPLLALFGEEPAKQYLSQSVSWQEDLLFAIAPLGILTIVIGAIRVAGYAWLRTLIGRAREPTGVSEMEYLSSTSENVYEFYDRKGIVRQLGNQKIHPVLFDNTPGSQVVMDLLKAEYPQETGGHIQDPYIRKRDKFNRELQPTDPEASRKWYALPPNLTLNAHAPIDDRFWIPIWTGIALIIQLGVVAFQAAATYSLKWRNPDFANFYDPKLAFPLASGGLFVLGYGVV